MSERIYLSPPHMSGEELELVKKVFESNWIAPVGPDIDAFESEISGYIGGVNTCALSSGTAAVHLALRILNVKPDDVVICQSLTFAGSANPIVYERCRPVFIDSERETWNMDPELLEEAIKYYLKKGKKPKAIIYVHIYGMPAKIEELTAIARRYDIPLIEDAAEALGSKYKGENVGKFGDISILSFNGNKIITTSGGGAFLSKVKKFTDKAKFLSTQAKENFLHYEHKEIGYNYRMSNVCAAIGRGQLRNIDDRVEKRREVYHFYKSLLHSAEVFTFLDEPRDSMSNRWLTCILANHEAIPEKIFNKLKENEIESRPLWKPMHLQPVFKDAEFFGSGYSNALFEKGICLPSGSNLSSENIRKISTLILSIL